MISSTFTQIQRNLQLRIEEQGKYLQQMFEQQRKMENDKSKVSSSNVDDPSASFSKSEQNSPKNEKSDATEGDIRTFSQISIWLNSL